MWSPPQWTAHRHLPTQTGSISSYSSSKWEQLCTRNSQPVSLQMTFISQNSLNRCLPPPVWVMCVWTACMCQDSWLFLRNAWDVFDVKGAMLPCVPLMSSPSAQYKCVLVQICVRARSEFTAWCHARDTKPTLRYRRRSPREFKAAINY